MNHASFMSKLLRPTYVWRMAGGLVGFQGQLAREDQRPLVRSARTRMANAQAVIDQLVLERAEAIRVAEQSDEIRKFLEWLERQALSVCEPEMVRGRWEGGYAELTTEEVLHRYTEAD